MRMVGIGQKLRWAQVAFVVGTIVLCGLGPVVRGQQGSSSKSRGKSGTDQESVKIEPYKGEPIYLEEAAQVAKPKIVAHDTKKELYDDKSTVRVERTIGLYSDNSLAADGKYIEYHPNGKTFVEGTFKEGRQEGDWTYYFDNGQVNRKASYSDGKPNGSWEVFRADGTVSAKRSFKDGLRDGDWFTYDATGKQSLTEEHYDKGQVVGVWKTWHPNGKQKQQLSFKAGKRDGVSTEWDEKGQKLVELEYSDGKLNGTVTRYLPDGKTNVQKFKDGKFESESKQ